MSGAYSGVWSFARKSRLKPNPSESSELMQAEVVI